MPTQPLFDDPWSFQEYQARLQLSLDDSWSLSVISYGVPVGLDSLITKLEQRPDLDDAERWQSLDVSEADITWLPRGLILATMVQEDNPRAGTRSGFVNLGSVRGQITPADAGNDPRFA